MLVSGSVKVFKVGNVGVSTCSASHSRCKFGEALH